MRSLKHDYTSENDLCSWFMARAQKLGWRTFPETGGFDILLVASNDVQTRGARPGDQIGVQAKLRANIEVLAQAKPKDWADKGPDFHAVLVPVVTQDFESIARACGLVVFEGTTRGYDSYGRRRLVRETRSLIHLPASKRQYYDEPCWRPDFEIMVPAGVKSPKSVTPWKVNAVRFCLETLRRGYCTSFHFRAANILMSRWTQNKWIRPTGERVDKKIKYVLDESTQPPHLMWPEIAEKIILTKETP